MSKSVEMTLEQAIVWAQGDGMYVPKKNPIAAINAYRLDRLMRPIKILPELPLSQCDVVSKADVVAWAKANMVKFPATFPLASINEARVKAGLRPFRLETATAADGPCEFVTEAQANQWARIVGLALPEKGRMPIINAERARLGKLPFRLKLTAAPVKAPSLPVAAPVPSVPAVSQVHISAPPAVVLNQGNTDIPPGDVESKTASIPDDTPIESDAVPVDEVVPRPAQDACSPVPAPPSAEAVTEKRSLFEQAVILVTRKGKASASFLQQHLGIGWNRASRLIEQLQEAGVVSAADRNGKRDVCGDQQHGFAAIQRVGIDVSPESLAEFRRKWSEGIQSAPIVPFEFVPAETDPHLEARLADLHKNHEAVMALIQTLTYEVEQLNREVERLQGVIGAWPTPKRGQPGLDGRESLGVASVGREGRDFLFNMVDGRCLRVPMPAVPPTPYLKAIGTKPGVLVFHMSDGLSLEASFDDLVGRMAGRTPEVEGEDCPAAWSVAAGSAER